MNPVMGLLLQHLVQLVYIDDTANIKTDRNKTRLSEANQLFQQEYNYGFCAVVSLTNILFNIKYVSYSFSKQIW